MPSGASGSISVALGVTGITEEEPGFGKHAGKSVEGPKEIPETEIVKWPQVSYKTVAYQAKAEPVKQGMWARIHAAIKYWFFDMGGPTNETTRQVLAQNVAAREATGGQEIYKERKHAYDMGVGMASVLPGSQAIIGLEEASNDENPPMQRILAGAGVTLGAVAVADELIELRKLAKAKKLADEEALEKGVVRATKIARPPRHHVFPQEMRDWFVERGFDIDKYTLELEEGVHQALHRMDWNVKIKELLEKAEKTKGSKLTPEEILEIGEEMKRKMQLDGPYLPYND